jgi:hypothetical protein
MNTKAIVEIMQKSPTAEQFATYAACRERNARDGVTRLPAIRAQMTKEGFHPVPQDLLTMFRELERAGVGKLSGDKFQWSVSIKQVGEALVEPKAEAPKQKPEVPTKRFVMCFGNNKEAEISYTSTLTKEEVEFLCSKLLQHYR